MLILKELYNIQNETIEHKLPNYNGNISYFIEAAGDIFRELCNEPVDLNYISQKRRILRNFYTLTVGDIEEIKDTKETYPDWNEELDKYIVKVDDLEEETEIFDFGVYKRTKIHIIGIVLDRKERMLKALETIFAICFYAKGLVTTDEVSKMIKELDEMFDLEKGIRRR